MALCWFRPCTSTLQRLSTSYTRGPGCGTYKLPCLAHYDGPLGTDRVAQWLNDLGMTPYITHTHFLPFLHRISQCPAEVHHQMHSPDGLLPGEALESHRPIISCLTLMVPCPRRPYHCQYFSATADHQMLYPNGLLPGESLAPPVNKALSDFPTSHKWALYRGPRKSFSGAEPATDATHAPLGGSTGPAMLISAPLTTRDTNMVDSEVTPLAHSRLPHSPPMSL